LKGSHQPLIMLFGENMNVVTERCCAIIVTEEGGLVVCCGKT
jgi:hypothetical protein